MKVVFVFLSEPRSLYSPSVAALAAAVRAAGHDVACLPVGLDESIVGTAERVQATRADVVAISIMTRDWPGVRVLIQRLERRREAFIAVGGYHASLAPQHVARCPGVDAIGIGESELALPELLGRLSGRGAVTSFPGMWVRTPDGWTDPLPAAAPANDIATLPRWDYEIFGDVSKMLEQGINVFGRGKDRFMPTRASRGCPFDCTYCSAPRWGALAGFDEEGKRNVKPVSVLCDELAELKARYEPAGFEFWDEHFPVDVAWLDELACEFPRRVALPFRMEMHPSAANRQRLELLAAAGCSLFHCGVEVGDPDLRRHLLQRRTSDATLHRVFDDARELGLETSASVMVGLPGETVEQAERTLTLLRQLRPNHVFASTYAPLPGTLLGGDAFPTQEREIERFDEFRACLPLVEFPQLNGKELSSLHERYVALRHELWTS